MARIPTGDFGNTVAQPQSAARVSPDAFGAAEGRALAESGQQGQQIALQQMQQETRRRQEIVAREAQTNAARVRITKTNDLADAQDTLNRDILEGRVDKSKGEEEWSYRSGQILQDATAGVAPEYAGALQVEFEGLQRRGSNGIRDTLVLKDQDDTRANIGSMDEQYRRMAVKDRPRAVAEFSAILEGTTNLPAKERTQLLQKFKEDTSYTNAFSLVRASSRDINAVRAARSALDGEQFGDIDPQKRAALYAQLDGYETNIILRAEAQAREAERKRDAAMNKARAEFESSQARVDAGLFDSPEQITQTAQVLAGTPYLPTYKALQVQAREGGGFASMSVPQQRSALDQVNAQINAQGATEALVKRRSRLESTLNASQTDFKNDNLRAYVERQPGTAIPPLDLSNINTALSGIGQRLQLAQRATEWAGKPASPFTADEAGQLGVLLSNLPVQQRATAVATLGQQIGPQAATGLANQLDEKDRALALALKLGTTKTTSGRFTAELVLRGQQAIKEKTIKGEDTKSTDWRAAISQRIGDGRGFASDASRLAVSDAAYFINAGLAAEGRVGMSAGLGFNTSKSDAAQALDLAVGGKMIEFNGVNIPIPAGLDESDFNTRIKTLTPENFKDQVPDGKVVVGGAAVPLDDFIKTLPDSTLTSTATGVYNVISGNRVVTNTAGRRIVIKAR